jgi:amidase
MTDYDPLRTSAQDLERMLQFGEITSIEIIEICLEQIRCHNSRLKALVSVAPCEELCRIAEALDRERRDGRLRSPLHGIPIILKVRTPPKPDKNSY